MKNSIFSPSYWRAACGELKSLKRLVFAALVCALAIVVGAFYVSVGENLRVYFTFFIVAVGCSVYGPVVGIIAAAVIDTLNYVLFPAGAYFPGYLLSEMAGALIYSLFLYRRKITVLRLFGAKFCVNYLVNVLMGSLWSQMLYGKGYLYYMAKSLIKNTLLLPFEVILLAALFSLLLPVFSRFGLLPAHEEKDLRKLSVSHSAFVVVGLDAFVGAAACLYYSTTLESGPALFRGIAAGLAVAGIAILIAGKILNRKKKLPEDEKEA